MLYYCQGNEERESLWPVLKNILSLPINMDVFTRNVYSNRYRFFSSSYYAFSVQLYYIHK